MRLASVIAAICISTLALATGAEAKKQPKLKESTVRSYLKPVAKDAGRDIAKDMVAQGETGITLVAANVGDCERKSRSRIDCDLNFTFRDPVQGDLTCSLRAGVKYKSKKSRKLVMAILSDKPKCFVLAG